MIIDLSKLGRLSTLLLITSFAVVGSLLLSSLFMWLWVGQVSALAVFMSIANPLIIAPMVSWHFSGLIVKLYRAESRARYLASIDQLSRTLTRRAFHDSAIPLYQLHVRERAQMALIYIDIDHFKAINDNHGHAVGDEAIKHFGISLRKSIRGSDLVGRIGGEEFAIAAPRTDLIGAVKLAQQVKDTASQIKLVMDDGRVVSFTISLGVAIYSPQNACSFDELSRQADEALYEAKHRGRDTFAVHSLSRVSLKAQTII